MGDPRMNVDVTAARSLWALLISPMTWDKARFEFPRELQLWVLPGAFGPRARRPAGWPSLVHLVAALGVLGAKKESAPSAPVLKPSPPGGFKGCRNGWEGQNVASCAICYGCLKDKNEVVSVVHLLAC